MLNLLAPRMVLRSPADPPPGPNSPPPPPAPDGSKWLEQLPQDMRGEVAFKDIKDIPSLAKSYLNAQRMVGMDKLPLPKPDADLKEWDPVFARLGRPETEDKYELKPPEELKQLKLDGEEMKPLMTDFRKTAHSLGLTQRQAAGLFQWYATTTDKQMDEGVVQSQESTAAAVAALKKEYGSAFDQKVELAHRAASYAGGKELMDFFDSTGLGDHPILVKAFAKLGADMSEDKLAGVGKGAGAMTPDEAKAKIADLGRNAEWMKDYQDAGRPGHEAAVAERARLYGFAYPEPEKRRA